MCTFLLQSGVLWDICLVHCGICEMGLLARSYTVSSREDLHDSHISLRTAGRSQRGIYYRADSRFVPSQWQAVLLCNDVSHWVGANLESALCYDQGKLSTRLVWTTPSVKIGNIYPILLYVSPSNHCSWLLEILYPPWKYLLIELLCLCHLSNTLSVLDAFFAWVC